MLALYTDTPEFFNDICEEIRLFSDQPSIKMQEKGGGADGRALSHFFWTEGGKWHCRLSYSDGTAAPMELQRFMPLPPRQDAVTVKKLKKRFIKGCVYSLLKQYHKKQMPWGSLTGIRPTKLYRELAAHGGAGYADDIFTREFDVTDEKRALARQIADVQAGVLRGGADGEIDVYVGIPFCASRCRYCSFVSLDLNHALSLKPRYLAALEEEIKGCAPLLRGRKLRALYVGGGTPTSLDGDELARLLDVLGTHFSAPVEYTVEAGRPDTITKEKLRIIKAAGARRVSVNPQTTNEKTLAAIGRAHSAARFFEAFALARDAGFEVINADLILGLPGEGDADVRKTLEDILPLRPENITVHTLALKKASPFATQAEGFTHGGSIERSVALSQSLLNEAGYQPYYLYRQKYMNGNLENVGFSLPGHACLYNIDNMEETHSILALGAGGISKRVYPGGARLERAANVKDVKTYVERLDGMIQRKRELFGGDKRREGHE